MFVLFVLIVFVCCSSVLTSPAFTPPSRANLDYDIQTAEEIQVSMNETENYLRLMCWKVGVKDADPVISLAVRDYRNCFLNTSDFLKYGERFLFSRFPEKFNGMWDSTHEDCEFERKINDCSRKFLDSVGMCYGEDRFWQKKIWSLIELRTSFWCNNKAENLNLFTNEKGLECIESKLFEIKKCNINDIKEPKNDDQAPKYTKSVSNHTIGQFEQQFRETFSSENCKFYNTTSPCIFKQLQTCDSPIPTKLAESYFNQFYSIGCRNL